MTITGLLTSEELRRAEFPVARDLVFLGHAGVCPLPARVAEAIRAYALKAAAMDQEHFILSSITARARELAAQLIGAEPGEMALVGPTSLALSYVAAGFPWKAGDNVVIYFDDYPSNVYPWQALAGRGVQVRRVPAGELGRIETEEVMNQVNGQTRLVALASCHFISGHRLAVSELGHRLQSRGIAFCIDAIQTLGAFPTTVEGVDFLAADAHKWLLGPCGAGLMYVRRSWQESMLPVVYGWNNVRCPQYVAQEELAFRPGAQRYEAGTSNLLGLVGLCAALELLLEVGIENIAAELRRKRDWLVPALQAKGWTVLNAGAQPANSSAIVSFHRPGHDMTALHQKLFDAGVITSLRADRSGRRYIRVSPHFYNTDEELNRFLEGL